MEEQYPHFNDLSKKRIGEDLIKRLEELVEANMNNEQFGVEALAVNIGMNRSNLHRKLQQYSGQSISQFIREYRLRRGLDYLENEDLTVSEVAFKVGFSSASYFTSCFTEYFGYPPSNVKYKLSKYSGDSVATERQHASSGTYPMRYVVAGTLLFVIIILALFIFKPFADESTNAHGVASTSQKSIAILPFKNLSDNAENEYFVDGVAGAITTNLAGIAGLNVISSISTNKYKNSDLSAKGIADELHVSHLLEGSIQRYKNIVRVEVRLIEAQSERQVWAKNYDRELKDIFEIQSEIAEHVVLTLKSKLTPKEKTVINQRVTGNTEAYDLYLKGLYQIRIYTTEGNHKAIAYFKQAIALDSGFALAYSGLALGHISRATIFGAELEPDEAFAKAKPLLDLALQLDPNLEEAHFLTGFYYLYNNWDFKKAEEAYKKGIVNDHPDALSVYADYLNFVKRHDEALKIAERLNRVHPHYPNSRMILSLYYMEAYEEAEAFAKERLKIFSNYYTYDSYGFLILNTGNYQEAIAYFQKAINIEGIRYPRMLGWMGAAYAKCGQRDMAFELVESLKIRHAENTSGSVAFFIAVIYAALDEKANALQWLQTSYQHHEMEIPWLITEPQFYPLHDEPAFREMVRKVGFPNTSF